MYSKVCLGQTWIKCNDSHQVFFIENATQLMVNSKHYLLFIIIYNL